MLIVAALTAVGVALRLAVAHQSLAADELSTRWIVAGHGLGDVLSAVRTDAEITPPLSFVAAWLTTRIDVTPELLRAPSLVAGAAVIPLVYAVGLRTVGRRAALVATALTAFSPFMIFYSAEARGYELMIAARPGLDARAARRGRRRADALVGGLRRLRVRRRLHPLHQRLRARRAAAVAAVGASRRRAARRSRERRRGRRVRALAPRAAGPTWTPRRPTSSPRCSRSARATCGRASAHWVIGYPYACRARACATCRARRRWWRSRSRSRPGSRASPSRAVRDAPAVGSTAASCS